MHFEKAGTEHLLLAMLKETDCVGTRLLYTMGANIQKLYAAVLTAMGMDSDAIAEEFQAVKAARNRNGSATPTLDQYSRDLTEMAEEGRLEELADTGARIQMNYSSIDGGWNNNTAQWCKRQLKDGLVHYLGTDMHNSGERSPQTEHVEKWLNKNLSEDYVWALIQGNARRILDDRGSHKPKT